MLMLTGGTWCKGENSTRECINVCWCSVFVSLRVIRGVFGKSFRIWKQIEKRITESLRANQRHLLTKRAEGDVYLKRLEKRRLISKVNLPRKYIDLRRYIIEWLFLTQTNWILSYFYMDLYSKGSNSPSLLRAEKKGWFKSDQERIKGTEKASPIHTLFHG